MAASGFQLSAGAAGSPYDSRRFDQLREEEVIRRIGRLLATALVRKGRRRRESPASAGCQTPSTQVDQAFLLRDEAERRILNFLQCAGPMSPLQIGRTLGLSPKVITRRLTRLRVSGVCEVEGRTRAVRYRVRDDFSVN